MMIEKVKSPGATLSRNDLTPEQKKILWTVMSRHDATMGFSYGRFFQTGFKSWELLGIDHLVGDFSQKHGLSAESLGDFYAVLGQKHLRLAFARYMGEHGMGRSTVFLRFGKKLGCNFKDYERCGIVSIIAEFEKEAANAGAD